MTGLDPRDSGRWCIAVLAGGDSPEREVSLHSGVAVQRALAQNGHKIVMIDPAEVDLRQMSWNGIDAAFLALHGTFGEDGQVQLLLEQIGVPFTGSDSRASRLAISKSASKERFVQNRIPTPAYALIHESDEPDRVKQNADNLGFPLVVKPDAQGSSIGVSIVSSADELPQALSKCFEYDRFGIMEVAIDGTEWTVGMIDRQLLPLIQVETDRQFFDYHAKYEDDETSYRFGESLPQSVAAMIERVSCDACNSLDVTGITRVDVMLDRHQRPWVLEVNTIPGFTDHSLVPKAAAHIGIEMGELYERAILSCLKTQFSSLTRHAS